MSEPKVGMKVKAIGVFAKGLKDGETYTLKSGGGDTFNFIDKRGKVAAKFYASDVKRFMRGMDSGDKNGLVVVKESYTHYPSLKKLVNVHYTDPRNESEGDKYKIHAEVNGPIVKDGKGIPGTYVMYEDEAYPGNYIAVHVAKKLNEDGESNVTVVAMDKSRALVRDRMAYRRRRSQSISEQMLVDGGKEILGESKKEFVDPKKIKTLSKQLYSDPKIKIIRQLVDGPYDKKNHLNALKMVDNLQKKADSFLKGKNVKWNNELWLVTSVEYSVGGGDWWVYAKRETPYDTQNFLLIDLF